MAGLTCYWEAAESLPAGISVAAATALADPTGEAMLDALYVFITALFFVGCWIFAKACDRL